MDWYIKVLKHYAQFNGRARRKEYWYFFLFNILVSFCLGFVDAMTGTYREHTGLGLLSGLYVLFIIVPSLAVTARRLHDTNRSGWWMLINVIPLIGPIVVLMFLCQGGTRGGNEYGSDPKSEATDTGVPHYAGLSPMEKYDQLERLKRLLDSGALTEEEFQQEKHKLL